LGYNTCMRKQRKQRKQFSRRVEIFLEFLLFGIALGVIEDIIAITLITNEPITFKTFWIATAVAIPFAFIGEIIVDRKHIIPVLKK
jgi:hypothetical protein